MIKPFYIVVNPVASKFAKALQKALKERVVNKVFRRGTPKQTRTIISRRGNVLRYGEVLPYFKVTALPLNKVEQLRLFTTRDIPCPKYATTQEKARELESKIIFARTLINSTNGRGIIEFNRDDAEYPRAPLYTEYIPKKAEYRYHVFNGQVIDIQQKKKKRGFEHERDTRIRNLHNGYVYCRDGINPPNGAANLAIRAVDACGYDYGAVDIIYNEKRNQAYVLEVNSRPGLMGTTLNCYVKQIIREFSLEERQ